MLATQGRLRGLLEANAYVTGYLPLAEVLERIVTALAASAGIAVENARRYEQDRRLAVLEDRERIAVELHGHVLQRLFAAGLSMQAIATAVGGESAQRLEQLITDTDETIASIRSVIHSLGADGPGALPKS